MIFSYRAQTGEQIRVTGIYNEMKYDQRVGRKVAGDGGRTRVLRVMVAGEVAAEVVAGAAVAAVVWWARGWRRRVIDDVRVETATQGIYK